MVGVLLAAGSASRFGADKLMHPLPDGTPMALAAARALRAALEPAIAVVRPGSAALERLLRDAGLEVAVCPDAAAGMGHSLAHAVRASAGAAGWVVALADMPFVAPESIRRVAEALAAGAPIVAPSHRGERGHPVGFAARYGAELAALAGDAGAREILRRDRAQVRLVTVDDPGVLRDVDTQADLEGEEP
ncbi:MAG: nucleotidyltransferase family protein [Burkholderiales bacterium]|nr:nucleotidyltransferase family protein [Burkholderiales bacterium]